ncbi:MAG: hypothetical protein H6961_08255 [Chromatiaceae bacterium]|nr:hypothetical protein [Chromatiaceae bacterium]
MKGHLIVVGETQKQPGDDLHRQRTAPNLWVLIVLAFLFSSLGGAAIADHSDTHQSVGNIEIYLGLLPAEIIRGRENLGHTRMHRGVPTERSAQHLVIALFDRRTGARIVNARVSATLSAQGIAAVNKSLEPMTMSDAVSYGNYFPIARHMARDILLTIEMPGMRPLTASFSVAGGG